MHQRAKIDMNAVGGYQTSTFGNSDFIKSSNINNNSGSTNINIYANQEEIDYSDDSFNGLTAEDILQEKINWNKKQRERAIREKIEREQNEEIANIQQSIDIINNAIDAIDQELLEFDNLKNISSVDPSLANLFPACLYNSDSDYLDNLTDNEFEIILDILVRYGLESSDLDIAQFKEFVKSGKYLRMMLETTGSSMESLWCDNIERYLGESSNRRKDIGLYDPEEARKRDSYLNKELINIVLENVPGLLSEEDYALIYYIEYIADNYQGNGNAVFDDLKERLKESFENDTYEQFRAEIILQGKREVFRNNGYDYDEIKSGLEDATLQYFNGKIGDKAYRIYFTKIMTGNDNIYEFTINGYSGASNIRVPSIKGLENDFYLMIAEQYNDRAQQIKSEKAELNRMLTQYKNYKLECELLNLISTDDFEKYKKLDGVSIDSEYKEIMTNEELANYAYLYNKFGQDKAKQYITSKEEEFNSRVGLERAYDFISQLTVDGKFKNYDDMTLEEKEQLENLGFDYSAYNMLITGGKGLEEGFESFFEGLINVFNSDGVKSANDYERMYISMLLSSNWLLSGTYDITSSIGNMAFPMLISTLASIASANPTLGAAIGSTLMGLSSGGNSLEGMLQEGWSFQESFTYGVLTGLSETTLGFFLGGIPGLSKLDDIPGVKLGVKGFLSNMFKEGMEESTQSILEPYLKYLSTGVEQKINWEEVAKSGIYGMITSGLISGGKILIQGNYVSIDKLDPEAVEKIAEAQNDGIELEITEEILTDPIKAEEAVSNAMKSSTGAEVDAPVDMIANTGSNVEVSFAGKYDLDSAPYTGIGTSGKGISPNNIPSEILELLIEDPTTVFGYRFRDGSRFAEIDFSDYNKVIEYRNIRIEYLLEDEAIQIDVERLLGEGKSVKEIAEYAVNKRNQNKVNARSKMSIEERLKNAAMGNVIKYGTNLDKASQNSWNLQIDAIYEETIRSFEAEGISNPTDEMIYNKTIENLSAKLGITYEQGMKAAIGPDLSWCFESKRKKLGGNVSAEEIYWEIIRGSSRANPELNYALGLNQ